MSRAFHNQQYPQKPRSPILFVSPRSLPLGFSDIPFKELKLSNDQLGQGSFGTVFKAQWKGMRVAIKQFKTKEQIDSFSVEVKQLSCVKHDNIVKLYGSSHTQDSAYLVMEYAERGSLNHLLHDCLQQHYDLRHACSWAMQTAKGVAYLHGIRPKPIMHRDLKPANLLLFSRGRIIKICDFGTACTVKTQMTNNTGSASYMAPEVFATSSYLESGDVFSWSIVFWEILARQLPYATQKYSNPYQLLWNVRESGSRPSEIDDCPDIIWNLITQCWDEEPKRRPTMEEVVERMYTIFKLTETKSNQNHRQHYEHQHHNDHHLHQHHYHHHQHHQYRYSHSRALQQPDHQQQHNPSLSPSSGTATTTISETAREWKIRTEALRHRLEMLKKRREELEEFRTNHKMITGDATLDEFQQLKEAVELKKIELEKRQISATNTLNSGCHQILPQIGRKRSDEESKAIPPTPRYADLTNLDK